MKRVTLLILIFLFSGPQVVKGQVIGGLGFKGGVVLASQSVQFSTIEYTMETQPIVGPVGAIFIETFRRDRLSVQFDLAYGIKGSKTTTHSITINHLENDHIVENKGVLNDSKSNYLAFSPMARYKFELEQLTPYVLLGPRFDYLLSYRTSSDYPLETQNSFILGLTGGAGIEYDFSTLGLFLEIQYQPDLSPVTNQEPMLINNNALLLNMGIRVRRGSL